MKNTPQKNPIDHDDVGVVNRHTHNLQGNIPERKEDSIVYS
jgi:hypothetical protein